MTKQQFSAIFIGSNLEEKMREPLTTARSLGQIRFRLGDETDPVITGDVVKVYEAGVLVRFVGDLGFLVCKHLQFESPCFVDGSPQQQLQAAA